MTDLVDVDGGREIVPGALVRHVNDEQSFGICISRRTDQTSPMQCEVMWSQVPWTLIDIDIQSTQINAKRTKLDVRWGCEALPDLNSFFQLRQTSTYQVREEFTHILPEELQELQRRSISCTFEMTINGRNTLTRETNYDPLHDQISGLIHRSVTKVI